VRGGDATTVDELSWTSWPWWLLLKSDQQSLKVKQVIHATSCLWSVRFAQMGDQ
jgi:hypothetical protein